LGFEPAISGVRFRDPGPLDDDSVIEKDQHAKWLLEQGSNLQALRHLINRQARLPTSAIQDQGESAVGSNRNTDHASYALAAALCSAAAQCIATPRRIGARIIKTLFVAPDRKYDLPMP
jgi:hypothetical protein